MPAAPPSPPPPPPSQAMAQSLASWNFRINVVSRKDIHNLVPRHYLTSLALLNLFTPGRARPGESSPGPSTSGGCTTLSGAKFLDIGTGGGFPGLPLAVACPEAHFVSGEVSVTRRRFRLALRRDAACQE